MGMDMGMHPALITGKACKRKFRWSLSIGAAGVPTLSGETGGQVNIGPALGMLPPTKAQRPQFEFVTQEIKHLTETIVYPIRPKWKPITVTVYDIKTPGEHPLFNWIKRLYDPTTGDFKTVAGTNFLQQVVITMLDACGGTIEKWVFEQAYPQSVNFGEVVYNLSDIVTCDLTLIYARAYVI